MDEKYTSKLSPAVDYAAGAYLVIIAVLSIVGNSAVLITAARRKRLLKAPELLTINLAVTDIGMALSMYPLSIASAFSHVWIGGDPTCLYYGLMGMIFSVASIMTLAVMGLVRYRVAGTTPKSGSRFQRSTVGIFIGLIWCYALLWAVCPLLGWGGYGPEPYGMACSVDWAGYQSTLNDSTFVLALTVLCTFLPCVLIISSYSGIAWKLHKAYQTIQNSDQLHNYGNVERKVTLMAILVSSGFLVAWTPYVTVSLWTMFHPRGRDSVTPLVSLLPCLFAKGATAYNPFIYYIFRRSFRKELRELCFPHCCLHTAADDVTPTHDNIKDGDGDNPQSQSQSQSQSQWRQGSTGGCKGHKEGHSHNQSSSVPLISNATQNQTSSC
ncbi:opsin 8, group member a [Engraulis encrasicolus]|uniref:opsin 8, group member a n=1 Tax=Engraulis encrasicolus TaxID=184585 RepID=UPI002FD6543F